MSVTKRSLNVGVVGMGNLGVPIARNLAFKARNALYLQLHSRSMEKVSQIADKASVDGVTCAMRLHTQYRTITKWCDVVFTVLANVNAARYALLEADDAIVKNARPGQIIVDHTTVDVATSKQCEDIARRRGAHFLDAPICGNPAAALNGQLTVMVGGDGEVLRRILPIIQMYSEHVRHVGDCGAGSATKGISLVLAAAHAVAAAEAMQMAHECGVTDHRALCDALESTLGASAMFRRCAEPMQAILRSPNDPPPTSMMTIDGVRSDVSLVGSGSGHDLTSLPLLHRALKVFDATSRAGLGDRDVSAVVQFVGTPAVDEWANPPTEKSAEAEGMDAAPAEGKDASADVRDDVFY